MRKLNKYLKYEKLLESENKRELIKEIKQDILNSITNISIDELEIKSHTLYLICVLKAHGEKVEDIFEYAAHINKECPKELSKFYEKNAITEEANDNIYIKICQKYIKLIGERIIKH